MEMSLLCGLLPSCWVDVALFGTLSDCLVLLRLSQAFHALLIPLLYGRIQVTQSAAVLVATLAKNQSLLPLVFALCMEDPAATVNPEQWEVVVPQLKNLQILVISPATIPMPLSVIPLIQFRLIAFHAITAMQGSWVDFLAACPRLDKLVLHGGFYGCIPSRAQLPRLRAIKAPPAVVAKFSAKHGHLSDIWFGAPQSLAQSCLLVQDVLRFSVSQSRPDPIRISTDDLLLLISGAPAFYVFPSFSVVTCEGSPLPQMTNPLVKLATALDTSFPHLKSLFLVCSQGQDGRNNRRLLTREDAACFSRVTSAYSSAPRLRTFHFFVADGYVVVNVWGQNNEQLVYIDVDEQWDEVYSHPAAILGEYEYVYLFP
ncbi:hypothetical protein C8R45DRAFT_1089169 [Mycena sanguinolenta]|nr:hypothetical protein C8R45DRAFT_1089169 [Mycena sanguinolenta]